ncbi:MAG: heparan-alpha-glucosaminide N-acetyltransferase domain-containing protein [Planctomycetota bacterium]|nr:heparan-alpha-glucosaminide N-acetyltransferase domain-containing protein [Planctomycetota bacterium]
MCESHRSMIGVEAGHGDRLIFLDLARGLAIVFMIFQHSVLLFATGQAKGSLAGKTVLLLGGAPAAPVFLFIMGVFLGRPDRRVGCGVGRGLRLIALGYVLNLLRSTLPSLCAGQAAAVSATAPASPLASFWVVDILHMAGLSFILLTLLRRYVPFRWVWAGLAFSIAVVCPVLWSWAGRSGLYALWGAGGDVFFPLFPWVAYPLAGMVYSSHILRAQNRAGVMKRSAQVGGLLLTVGVALFFLPEMGRFDVGKYYRSGPGEQLAALGFILVWLPVCHGLARGRADSAWLRLLCFWSRNVTAVYFVQWVLFGWAVLFLGRNRHTSPVALAIAGVVLLVAHVTVKAYTAWARARQNRPDRCPRERHKPTECA